MGAAAGCGDRGPAATRADNARGARTTGRWWRPRGPVATVVPCSPWWVGVRGGLAFRGALASRRAGAVPAGRRRRWSGGDRGPARRGDRDAGLSSAGDRSVPRAEMVQCCTISPFFTVVVGASPGPHNRNGTALYHLAPRLEPSFAPVGAHPPRDGTPLYHLGHRHRPHPLNVSLDDLEDGTILHQSCAGLREGPRQGVRAPIGRPACRPGGLRPARPCGPPDHGSGAIARRAACPLYRR